MIFEDLGLLGKCELHSLLIHLTTFFCFGIKHENNVFLTFTAQGCDENILCLPN